MSDVYWHEHRAIQERFDTVRLADRLEEALVTDVIDDHARTFIEARDMFFLSTVDPQGADSVLRGGDPCFVGIDERTIAFPNYNGNGMHVSSSTIRCSPSSTRRNPSSVRAERAFSDALGT